MMDNIYVTLAPALRHKRQDNAGTDSIFIQVLHHEC